MNNTEKWCFNTMNEVLKSFYNVYKCDSNYEVKYNHSNAVFFTKKTELGYGFIDDLKNITDKRGGGYSIGVSSSNNLYIKIYK